MRTLALACCVVLSAVQPLAGRCTDSCLTRRTALHLVTGALGGGSLAYLATVWYAPYRSDGFHLFDDNAEWQQMDKAGHTYSGYALARLSLESADWGCYGHTAAVRRAIFLPAVYLGAIEIMDGFSPGYGASWGDLTADFLGIAMVVGQQAAWREQRISLKWSFHRSPYAGLRPALLGKGLAQEVVKDYNGQTYWLCFNLHSLDAWNKAPPWLGLALGYGAEGMTGGHGNAVHAFPGEAGDPIVRYRQYYLAPDLDLSRIPIGIPWLRQVLKLLDMVHLPLPALELHKGRLRAHALYF
ncbi:MAG TPA: DUF2279 domain-containing protein [Bacteroidales bacterium]|nr:DUF2279 domain-containing protein [Bacteroidales bacterium]HRZ77314.1 DUF2279 domain-containing protein [Bacteroidales bacterium]